MSINEGNWGDLLSGKNAARSVALSGGVALHAINIYIATTVLPSVVKEINGLELYAWNTTLFVVASILGASLTAKTLRQAGSRKAYAIGIFFFFIGSLVCALTPNMPIMLVGRSLQGFGGGFLFALSYSMIHRMFDETLWPRAMALVSGMWGIATLLGPAVGGIFAEMDAWRAAFFTLAPITLAYTILIWRVLPAEDSVKNETSKLPIPQLILLAAAVLVISASSVSTSIMWNMGGVLVAILLLILMIRCEIVGKTRMLPKAALHISSSLFALYATMGLLTIGMTSEIFVPYFLQTLHGQSPLLSGYIAALMAFGWTAAEILSSGWKAKGIRFAIVNGPIGVLIGLIILAVTMPLQGRGDSILISFICIGLVLVGFGIGLGWPHLLTKVLQVTAGEDQETAASSITTVQLFAAALGSALAGMLVNLAGLNEGSIESTSNAAFWLFAIFSLSPIFALITAIRSARAHV